MTESEFRDWVRGWLSSLDGRIKGVEGRAGDNELVLLMRGLKERIEELEGKVGELVRERSERRARLGRLHEARRQARKAASAA